MSFLFHSSCVRRVPSYEAILIHIRRHTDLVIWNRGRQGCRKFDPLRLRRSSASAKSQNTGATARNCPRRCSAFWQSIFVWYMQSCAGEPLRRSRTLKIGCTTAHGASEHRRWRRGAGSSTKIHRFAHLWFMKTYIVKTASR